MPGRIIQLFGTKQPQERALSTATLDDFKRLAEACEKREQLRSGGSREDARQRLARRIGVLPGTLYTLARDRLKRLDANLRDRLTAYAISDLQSEMERLAHDLAMARQMGAHQDSPMVADIEKHLAAARALIAEAANGKPG